MLDYTDNDLILYMAGCSLARKPGKNNWVEEDAVNGLPEYICRIARAINRSDPSKSISQVIAIAVNRVKVWAGGGGGVTAATKAKAAKAVAEWEKKKAAAKLNNKKVKASAEEITLNFANSYNIDDIRRQYGENNSTPGNYRWIREMWSDFLIVSIETDGQPLKFVKVPYSVDSDGKAEFGDELEVKQAFVEASHSDLMTELTDAQLEKAAMIPCTQKDNRSLVENIAIGKKLQAERVELLAFSADKPHLLKLLQEG
jgi:hypothetical protein